MVDSGWEVIATLEAGIATRIVQPSALVEPSQPQSGVKPPHSENAKDKSCAIHNYADLL